MKFVLIVLLAFLPMNKAFHAETEISNARALFIYNFLSHIQWPEESLGTNFILGVIGNTTTYDYLLKYTEQRKIGKRGIEVKKYHSANEVNNCQVLLVAQNKNNEMPSIKQKLNGKSCLIVGEKAGSTKDGAVIDFNIINGRLRYRIDENNAKNHNLFIGSSLLQMSL